MSYGDFYHIKEVLNETSSEAAHLWSVGHTLNYNPFQKMFRFITIYG